MELDVSSIEPRSVINRIGNGKLIFDYSLQNQHLHDNKYYVQCHGRMLADHGDVIAMPMSRTLLLIYTLDTSTLQP